MVFSSTVFLFVFLPAFLSFYALIGRFRNLVLLGFSLAFYAFGEGYFLFVMVISITANYGIGLRIVREASYRRIWLWLGIALNLSLLAGFKYAHFIHHDVLGFAESQNLAAIHLPIGISFFTFQSISYLIDVYRDPERVEISPVRFATYIAMFPQLIAGPIVRFRSVAAQLTCRSVTAKHVYFGGLFFAVGLAEKVLLADTLAEVADAVFRAPPTNLSAGAAWLGGVAYSLQIFFDFSGYSAMAIGLGLILGFEFPRNFNFPYIAQSITEFWRRWHLSLSAWFRDYVYIPLGGNRAGSLRTYRNLAGVFLLTGLWHGAAWNFLLWGLWHGLFIVIERMGLTSVLRRFGLGLRIAYTLVVVYVGWVLFRAQDLEHAFALLSRHVATGQSGIPAEAYLNNERIIALIIGVCVSTPLLMGFSKQVIASSEYGAWHHDFPFWKYLTGVIVACVLFSVAAIKVLSGAYSPFIYFRF